MDTGEGTFKELENTYKDLLEAQEKYPNHGGVFKVGEVVELKGSRFKIKAFGKSEMRLKLLKK